MPKAAKKVHASKVNIPKTPRKKLPKIYPCPVQGKLSFTEKEAKLRAKETGLRAYKCAWCPYWHRTHKIDNMKKH